MKCWEMPFHVSWKGYSKWNLYFQKFNENSKQKILGVTIDNKLKCKSHMKELYKKNLSNYLNDFEKKLVFNCIVKSQFSCHWGFLFQSRFLCQHFMFLQSSGDIWMFL